MCSIGPVPEVSENRVHGRWVRFGAHRNFLKTKFSADEGMRRRSCHFRQFGFATPLTGTTITIG